MDKAANRPGYDLRPDDQAALQAYYSEVRHPSNALSKQAMGRELLVALNCLGCHQREGIDRVANALPIKLQDKLAAVAHAHEGLAVQIPAMTPPALNSIGDKLHEGALEAAIRRRGDPHRPYLLARMPRFDLSDEEVRLLSSYFVASDRIVPSKSDAPQSADSSRMAAFPAAGPRLVTTDGFGCTSCHQVGSVLPSKAPLNARGPDLSMLEKRIRREWFFRWCAAPARIVPRMEMPSVQIPVRGVLNENIEDQLDAVWHVLNLPGFQPPEPNPIRVLRRTGVPEHQERGIVLQDVIKDGSATYLFPIVVGLPNRQNLLLDLEANRLAGWWLGDVARQRTKGKTWHWEPGGATLAELGLEGSEIALLVDGKEISPQRMGQFLATLDGYRHTDAGDVILSYRLAFKVAQGRTLDSDRLVNIAVETGLQPIWKKEAAALSGFRRAINFRHIPPGIDLRVRAIGKQLASQSKFDEATGVLRIPGDHHLQIKAILPTGSKWNSDGSFDVKVPNDPGNDANARHSVSLQLDYLTSLSADQYLADPLPAIPTEPATIEVAPGMTGRRLPLPDDIMPTGIAWTPKGDLLYPTLKGRVFRATDRDRDGLEEHQTLVIDGLATPYGIWASEDSIDVLIKTGLLRLSQSTADGHSQSVQTAASGWGYTDDYHDWAVGLVKGKSGEYIVGLPCQQDERSEAAARHRGHVLRLIPREPSADNPRLFDLETISAGHRFPMGLAVDQSGELFVTDNQGNYNPFNELNHVRQGAHFGFINALEKEKGYKPPPLANPAINLPHPWTRSVNGICFLDTPTALRSSGRTRIFGPLEGHLIGCEYDTRQLIRMTLQQVGDGYQGAAYPLSVPPSALENGLLGPIIAAVSPRGQLYVGNIRDSGWGAGNNIGDIVQITIEPDKLPCGIREVRAVHDGFTIEFFQPIDAQLGAHADSYSIQSYRRESTPAYGGPDFDRRTEKVLSTEVSEDRTQVILRLEVLRSGFVYELRLKNLAPNRGQFHPDEAHYTMRTVPPR